MIRLDAGQGGDGGSPALDLTLAGPGAFGTGVSDGDVPRSALDDDTAAAAPKTNYRVVTYTSDVRFAGTDANV